MDFNAPLEVARWRVIGNYIMAIPHFIVGGILVFVAGICSVIGWFAILFTGNMPEGLFNLIVTAMRYQWRTITFAYFMREDYPPFDMTPAAADNNMDTQVHLSVDPPQQLSRGLIFIKWLLVIPHLIVLAILGIGVAISVLVGFFAVLFTGKWPEGLRTYVLNVMKWGDRVFAYMYLLTDAYPPFALA
jgi:hypothetical protein